jgi:AcrR family transcriptional regulator
VSFPKPTTDRGRATRQALLDAAEQVFAEYGFNGASVAEITRRAGVAQGTFYVHFPDKKAAFLELVDHVNHQVRETSAKAISDVATQQAQERAGFAAFFRHVAADPAVYRIIRQTEFVDEEAYQQHYQRIAVPYSARLKEAMANGEIAEDIDPELLAYILMGIAEFMGMKLVLWEHRLPESEAFDQMMRFILRGMGMSEDAA